MNQRLYDSNFKGRPEKAVVHGPNPSHYLFLELWVKFYWNTNMPIHLCIGYGCFCPTRADLTMAYKTENIYFLALNRANASSKAMIYESELWRYLHQVTPTSSLQSCWGSVWHIQELCHRKVQTASWFKMSTWTYQVPLRSASQF